MNHLTIAVVGIPSQ